MKLSFRDRIILIVAALLLVSYGAYHLLWTPGIVKTAELEAKKTELEGLAVDITPLIAQTETLRKQERSLFQRVNELKESNNGATITKENFLIFLGDAAAQNGVKVSRFNDLGTKEEQGVWRAAYNFELQGTAEGMNHILAGLEELGVKYSVGSVSFRQVKDYPYLKRYFDDMTDLPWFQTPEPTEEPAPTTEPEKESEMIPAPLPLPTPEPPPYLEPTPEPIPTPAPPIPEPPPEESYDDITDRLDKLLEQTAFRGGYKIRLLTNAPDYGTFDYGNEMRLAVTIEFIMCREPNGFDGAPKGEV